MENPVDRYLRECGEVIDRFPVETRWDIMSAILAEPNPFYKFMLLSLTFASAREQSPVSAFCQGMVGSMLLGNLEDGGFLYNPHASPGEAVLSGPDWYGTQGGDGVINKVVLFTSYSDQIVSARSTANDYGLVVVDEYALKGLV